MSVWAKPVLKELVRGLAWLLFGAAFVSFWATGGVLHECAGVDRVLGEMIGIGAAVILGGLGAILRQAAEDSSSDSEP